MHHVSRQIADWRNRVSLTFAIARLLRCVAGLTLASAGVAGTLTIYNNWGTIRRDLGTEAATVAHDVLADDQVHDHCCLRSLPARMLTRCVRV